MPLPSSASALCREAKLEVRGGLQPQQELGSLRLHESWMRARRRRKRGPRRAPATSPPRARKLSRGWSWTAQMRARLKRPPPRRRALERWPRNCASASASGPIQRLRGRQRRRPSRFRCARRACPLFDGPGRRQCTRARTRGTCSRQRRRASDSPCGNAGTRGRTAAKIRP